MKILRSSIGIALGAVALLFLVPYALLVVTLSVPQFVDTINAVRFSLGWLRSKEEITQEAIRGNKPELCGSIAATLHVTSGFPALTPENKIACLQSVARSTHNLTACTLISPYLIPEDPQAIQCLLEYAQTPTDYKYCDKLQYYRGNCYGAFAAKAQDLSICISLRDIHDHDECLRKYAFTASSPNPAACDLFIGIPNTNFDRSWSQRDCLRAVAGKAQP